MRRSRRRTNSSAATAPIIAMMEPKKRISLKPALKLTCAAWLSVAWNLSALCLTYATVPPDATELAKDGPS